MIDGDSGIIAGHGRVLAAELLELEQVPTIALHGLSEQQKKAYIIADNKLALNAGWDEDLLRLELAELKDLDFDLDLIGFNDDELDSLLNFENENSDNSEEVFSQNGENSQHSVELEYITFGKYKIPISADELEQLESKLNQYNDNYGGSFGFVTYLLGGAE